MSDLKVGDLCITRNGDPVAPNNGLFVEIGAIDRSQPFGCHYGIRRIDGEPFPASYVLELNRVSFDPVWGVWAARSHLIRIGPEELLHVEGVTGAVARTVTAPGALPAVALPQEPVQEPVQEVAHVFP